MKPYLTKEQGVTLFEGGSVQFPGVLLFQLYSSFHVPLSCLVALHIRKTEHRRPRFLSRVLL